MKYFTAAMIAGAASAARQTTYECLEEEDATIVEDCFGMYMNLCQKIEIHPNGTCNVMVFKPAAVEWSANDISVDYFTLSEVILSKEDAELEINRRAAEQSEIDARRGQVTVEDDEECYFDEYYGEYYDYDGELCDNYQPRVVLQRDFLVLKKEKEEGDEDEDEEADSIKEVFACDPEEDDNCDSTEDGAQKMCVQQKPMP
jgi:hypothetical protein